jgi:hypothetical protein
VADRRAFGWCRFEELIADCNGYPAFQYFIPTGQVFTASSAIFPLPYPNSFSSDEKQVMYNKDAYCFVRQQKLYKRCTMENMIAHGYKQIPDFPRSAIVIKTGWKSEDQMNAAGKDKSKHYSYVYKGDGIRYYLVAFHFTTKDVDNWYWADFYVPETDGFGGCEGNGADRPGSITGVWANYVMCTNLEESETVCGNNFFGECGQPQTCVGCHKNSSTFFGTSGTLFADFLPSMAGDGTTDPCP